MNSHFEITSRPVVSCGLDGSSWYCISVYGIFLSQYNHCKAIEQFLLFLLQVKLICILLLGWDWIFSWDVRCEMWGWTSEAKIMERLLLQQYIILQHISPQV